MGIKFKEEYDGIKSYSRPDKHTTPKSYSKTFFSFSFKLSMPSTPIRHWLRRPEKLNTLKEKEK